MSCAQNKIDAVAAWGAYSSGSSPIQILELTSSSNNTATISATKGTATATLTFSNSIYPNYVRGTGALYLKISKQTDGFSDSGVNPAPVTATDPATYVKDTGQTVTLNASFVSTTYASATPAFSPSQTCGTSNTLGWQMSDAQVVMTRTILQPAAFAFS